MNGDLQIKHTVCPECSVGCGVDLIIKDGKVVGVHPYRRHTINEGKNCIKGRNCYKVLYDENRVLYPIIKRNDEFKELNWDEVLNIVADKLKEYPPEEIGIIVSGKCTTEEFSDLKKFSEILNIKNIGVYDENIPEFSRYLEFFSNNMEDEDIVENSKNCEMPIISNIYDNVESCKNIVIIGDVFGENSLIGRRVIKARENGANVISINYEDKPIVRLNSDEFIKITDLHEFLNGEEYKDMLEMLKTGDSIIICNKLKNQEDINLLCNISKETGCKILPVLNHCNTRGAIDYLPLLNREDIRNIIKNVKFLIVIDEDLKNNIGEELLKSIDFLVSISLTMNETCNISDLVIPSLAWIEKNQGTFKNTIGLSQKISKIVDSPTEILSCQRILEKILELNNSLK